MNECDVLLTKKEDREIEKKTEDDVSLSLLLFIYSWSLGEFNSFLECGQSPGKDHVHICKGEYPMSHRPWSTEREKSVYVSVLLLQEDTLSIFLVIKGISLYSLKG